MSVCKLYFTLQAYTQAISSSKSVAIVNLDASDTQIDTLNAISVVLKETLNEDDYVALFSPGINTSDTEGSALNQATETKVARLCSQLAGASLSDNDTPDFQLLSSAINVLQENNASGISPCYQGLLIFLDSTTLETQELREMITSAFERNENLTIFLNVLDGLSAEEFANASRLFCNTKTVIQSISPADGYANRSVVNYVNYFFHGKYNNVTRLFFPFSNALLFLVVKDLKMVNMNYIIEFPRIAERF